MTSHITLLVLSVTQLLTLLLALTTRKVDSSGSIANDAGHHTGSTLNNAARSMAMYSMVGSSMSLKDMVTAAHHAKVRVLRG